MIGDNRTFYIYSQIFYFNDYFSIDNFSRIFYKRYTIPHCYSYKYNRVRDGYIIIIICTEKLDNPLFYEKDQIRPIYLNFKGQVECRWKKKSKNTNHALTDGAGNIGIIQHYAEDIIAYTQNILKTQYIADNSPYLSFL